MGVSVGCRLSFPLAVHQLFSLSSEEFRERWSLCDEQPVLSQAGSKPKDQLGIIQWSNEQEGESGLPTALVFLSTGFFTRFMETRQGK